MKTLLMRLGKYLYKKFEHLDDDVGLYSNLVFEGNVMVIQTIDYHIRPGFREVVIKAGCPFNEKQQNKTTVVL